MTTFGHRLALSTCRLSVRLPATVAGKYCFVRIRRSKTRIPFKPEDSLDDAGPRVLFLPASLGDEAPGTQHQPAAVEQRTRSGACRGKKEAARC